MVVVSKRDPKAHLRSLALGFVALLLAVVGLLAAVQLLSRNPQSSKLGDNVFYAGLAEVMAKQVASDGPIFYADLLGGSQGLVLQHIGLDPEFGWSAFELSVTPEATSQGSASSASQECILVWQPQETNFRSSCDESHIIAASGFSQPNYPVSVNENGELVIDLRAAAGDGQ